MWNAIIPGKPLKTYSKGGGFSLPSSLPSFKNCTYTYDRRIRLFLNTRLICVSDNSTHLLTCSNIHMHTFIIYTRCEQQTGTHIYTTHEWICMYTHTQDKARKLESSIIIYFSLYFQGNSLCYNQSPDKFYGINF